MLYHKIQTMFKRTQTGELINYAWTDPVFKYLAVLDWRCTEKIDGTNIRVTIDPISEAIRSIGQPEVSFGGRTDNAQLPAKLVDWLTAKFLSEGMQEALIKKFPDGGILYGEGFGAGIQKGGGKYQDIQSFVLFDVRVGDWWLRPADVLDVAQTLELDIVPLVGHHSLFKAIELVRDGLGSFYGDFQAEGLVATPVVPLFTRSGDRVITKLKTRDFLRVVEKE